MRNGVNKWWIVAYLVGVGLLSSGVSVACSFINNGEFHEEPSPYWGAYGSPDCLEPPWNAPRCGYFLCTSNACGTYSHVSGCTWATETEMYDYMQMGCRDEGCTIY